MDRIEGRDAFQGGGSDDGCDGGISPGTPTGTETADDLAMHDGGAQVTLTDIIGWADICPMQEDKKAVPVLVIAFRESFGFGLVQRAYEQPVANLFNPLDLRLELWW